MKDDVFPGVKHSLQDYDRMRMKQQERMQRMQDKKTFQSCHRMEGQTEEVGDEEDDEGNCILSEASKALQEEDA